MILAMRRRGDDEGAVAVLVAIVVTLVLIPVAALAADLGSAYVRVGALQQAADAAVRAAAQAVAVAQHSGGSADAAETSARRAAASSLCAEAALAAGWSDVCASGTGWAQDGDDGNGEVTFYAGAPDPTLGFTTGPAPTGSEVVSGVRVLTPPSTQDFTLARVFGANSVTVQKAATAALATVLPARGVAPFYATAAEALAATGTARVPWCARDLRPSLVNLPLGVSACDGDWLTHQPGDRGFLDVTRTDPLENQRRMIWNVADGLERPLEPHAGATGCPATTADALTCVTVTRSVVVEHNWTNDTVRGLVGDTSRGVVGRLTGDGTCLGGDLESISGGWHVESAHLGDFVDETGGSWTLRPEILRCGRLAVVPVLDVPATAFRPTPTAINGSYAVQGLRLLWIDGSWSTTDPAPVLPDPRHCYRGLRRTNDCGTGVRAVTGYLLDPALLPATVHGVDAATTVAYTGGSLPATVRLIRDVGDPPPG